MKILYNNMEREFGIVFCFFYILFFLLNMDELGVFDEENMFNIR